MALKEQAKRARSDGQKAMRQAEILAAARVLIRQVGFEAVTMNALADQAGLAKGTLYLYVRSKEELYLLLFIEAMETLLSDFKAKLGPGESAERIAEAMAIGAIETPLFLPLFARLLAVIEANVADEPFFRAKRRLLEIGTEYERHLGHVLGVDEQTAQKTARALTMTMQGAAQFDLTSKRDPSTLPDDLKDTFASHAFEVTFQPAARLILSAVKSGAAG